MKFLKAIFFGLITAVLVAHSPISLAVYQLGTDILPDGMPNLMEEIPLPAVTDEANPETAATQAVILVVGNLLSRVLVFAATLAIVFLIVSGARFIIGFGKDGDIEAGKRGIYWAIVGLLIILGSYAIVQAVLQILVKLDSSTP